MFSLTNRMYLMAAKKQPSMMMKMNPHLRWTLTSALYVLLKNQLSKTLSRLFPRQKRFHL